MNPITATEIRYRIAEGNRRLQEAAFPVLHGLMLTAHRHLWDIIIRPENMPRTTTRKQWKQIDQWRRECRRRIRLETEKRPT